MQEIRWKDVSKDIPVNYRKMKDNPMTEAEIIDLIKDNNLPDKQLLVFVNSYGTSLEEKL